MQTRQANVVAGLTITVLGLALAATVGAQRDDDPHVRRFPGEAVDASTLEARRQVETLYSSGAFDRALLIYEKDLAPLGDKYAQYMVGFMHLTGQGVTRDRARALAWYRLAAERGEAPLVKARDHLERKLDPDERARADAIFAELWQRYSDRRLLLDLMAEDIAILRERGDSPLVDVGAGSPVADMAAGYFGSDGGADFHRRVRERLERRARYLDSVARLEDLGGVAGASALRERERALLKAIETLD